MKCKLLATAAVAALFACVCGSVALAQIAKLLG